jgi:DNA-binding NtrC family response regulator
MAEVTAGEEAWRLAERPQHINLVAEDTDLETEDLASFREHEGIIGRSRCLVQVLSKIRRIGPHFLTALITGATGTGKELAARALHRMSAPDPGPVVACNCAGIVETLFESELFGHHKGAFTGATRDTIGIVEHAEGGTLFLDEVGELPLTVQAKLLRVLETREVRRVGSTTTRQVHIRVIAATNRDIRDMVVQHQFREDLYFRLATVELRLPRLAARREDLPLLEKHFLEKYALRHGTARKRLSPAVRSLFTRYSWPGNVREMENVIAHGCMIAQGEWIEVGDLPEHLSGGLDELPKNVGGVPLPDQPLPTPSHQPLSMEQMRASYIDQVLEAVHGNQAKAAQLLGIGRTTLHRYLRNRKTRGIATS